MGDSDAFQLLYSGKSNDVVPIYKYKSKASGMTVVIAQVEGPIVNGYFCLATEAHDDDGLPHTLEHLIFMGSEQYPYKGVLDLLANRCLASGTNAWTDTDHTCYTMTTAGSEGFLNLMPIFLDHVLYPTLTDSAYVTEVHHVTGEAEDAGVVYCEMQARENTGESLCQLSMQRAMYDENCGYRSETGGLTANLRDSTSNEKVCMYHQQFYQPENLCLIITGQVTPEQVFKSLTPFEERIAAKGRRPVYKRPWQTQVPPLSGSVDQVVPYPSDEEEHGIVTLAWRAPKADEYKSMSSIMMMMEYLTDTAVAPLQRDFVEIDDPYCSSVGYNIIENAEGCVSLTFQNVPRDKIVSIKDRANDLLVQLGTGKEEVDMNRMGVIIHRSILEALSALEDQPHDTIAFHVIGEFLYGNTPADMEKRTNQIATFRELEKEDQSYWVQLINKYLVDRKTVTILGVPSQARMAETGDVEKARVADRLKTMGPDELKSRQNLLKNATADNEKEAPQQMLTSVDVPDLGAIVSHNIQPSNNHSRDTAYANPKFPLDNMPVRFQLDDITTNFVSMHMLMNTEGISEQLRWYLPLYVELLLESPIVRDGVVISHEDVINELASDTVSNSANIGLHGNRFSAGSFDQIVQLHLKVELGKYNKGVQWIRELLFQVKFKPERIKIIANKMIKDVATLKRHGRFISRTIFADLLFKQDTNVHLMSMLRQHKFLSQVMEKLDNQQTADKLVADLESLREQLTQTYRLTVHMAASTTALQSHGLGHKVWENDLLPKQVTADDRPRPEIKMPHEFLRPAGDGPGAGVIVGVGSVESAYLLQASPGVNGPLHADLAPVLVLKQYLTQLEGPMWRQIRGLGYSYSYSIRVKPSQGLLYLSLFKSTNLVGAYKVAREIVAGYTSGKVEFTELELENSKSSLAFEIIEEEQTPQQASGVSLMGYLEGTPHTHNKDLLAQVSKVTVADLQRIAPLYFGPMFDSSLTQTAVCCHPNKVDEIVKGFEQLSKELKPMKSLEDSFLSEI